MKTDELVAGRELDALVVERCLKGHTGSFFRDEDGVERERLLAYSTDREAAMTLLAAWDGDVELEHSASGKGPGRIWYAWLYDPNDSATALYGGEDASLSMSIVKAMLVAASSADK